MFIKLLKPFSFLPAILLMYMIFSFSAQDGVTSSALSYRVSYAVVSTGDRVLNLNLEPERMAHIAERAEGIIRKCAHVGEYFLLAIAVAFPFYVYGLRGLALMLVAGLICVAFACTDEYHQSFVDGRSPGVRDVLIDSAGVFCGIILVRIVGWTGRMTIFRPFTRRAKRRRQKRYDAYYEDPSVSARYRKVSDEPSCPKEDEEGSPPDGDILSEDMSLKKLFWDLTSGSREGNKKNK